MAEFQKVIAQFDRMCEETNDCDKCPLTAARKGTFLSCIAFMRKRRKKAEEIIMKWAEEHPVMTNGKKFEEVFGFSPYMKFQSYEDMKQWIESEWRLNKEYEK